MTAPSWLLTLPVILPLSLAVLTLLLPSNWLSRIGRLGALGCAATIVPCTRWIWENGPLHQSLGGWGTPLGIDLYLDGMTCLFLIFSALMGLGISFYAAYYFAPTLDGSRSRNDLFWPLWFVTWGGIQSLFLSQDLFNIYVTLELISISGVGLILIAGTRGATRAALQYQMQALIAGLVYLLGVGMVYNAVGTLDLQLMSEQLQPGPMKNMGMALMTSGILIKAALFPMHFWLPRAHADAPAPVSAVLSGLVVTVAFVMLTRIWFAGLHRLAPFLLPRLLGGLGSAGIVWGGILALRQTRLKRILAYSTVSQIGYLFLVFALTFYDAPGQGMVWTGAVYLAISHGLSKGAAFLVAGYLQKAEGSDQLQALKGSTQRHPVAVMVLALASINLMGLPPSTGFIGKWMMLKAAFYTEQWGLAVVMLGGGLLAALYLFRVFEILLQPATETQSKPTRKKLSPSRSIGMLIPAMLLALATLIPALFIRLPETLLRIGAPVPFSNFISPGDTP
jgi:formate hydrogenlyase subunit 3/multisubunit Na+/H+ antiporter MnhD subunit